jgi:4-amino-4-deoxy-L-arabinose transferase-like glycosyltransferase
LAFLSRSVFLNFNKQLPVFWDARLYASSAIGLLGYLDRDEPFGKGDNTAEDFARYYTRYLNGEDIHWLYYKVPTLAESQRYLFYSGPIYPAILATIFAIDWQRDFQVVRWLNAVLDSLTAVILAMLVFLIWGRAPAIIAALLQLLYIPSIITSGVLTLETITSFLISLFLLASLIYYLTEKKWAIVICGLLGGVMVLAKPTASLLTIPLFVFLTLVYFRRLKFLLSSAMLYLIPFMVIVTPWIIFTSGYYGQLAFRDPEYSQANFRTSSSIEYEGYDLDYADPDFWTYSVADHVLSNPIGYANLLSKKIIRMWWVPHDEFWQGPEGFETTYHRLLIIGALFALAVVPLMRKPFLFLPLLLVGYYGGIHLILHALPRYNFNALPAIFILAVSFIAFISGKIKKITVHLKDMIPLIAATSLLLILNAQSIKTVILPFAGIVVPALVTILLILLVGYFYIRNPIFKDAPGTLRKILWLPFILLCVIALTSWSRPQLREWYTQLNNSETMLITEIHLPPGMRFARNDVIKLVIDMTSDSTCRAPINVILNGSMVKFTDAQEPIVQSFFTKGTYRAFHGIMDYDLASLRWYRKIGINAENINEVLRPDGILVVAISVADSALIGNGLRLYGNYSSDDEDSVFLPSFSHRSIERFRELGDRRIYEDYKLNSHGGFSYIYCSGEINRDDLSNRPGRQQGRYRVYLIVERPDFKSELY